MGAAAYNRGTRAVARGADADAQPAAIRAERHALKDERARLLKRVAELEGDLRRARRCLAAERHGREQLRLRLLEAERQYRFAVSILCRLAFPPPPVNP